MALRRFRSTLFVSFALTLSSDAAAGPINLLRVTGDPGDWVTQGQTFTFTANSGAFSVQRNADRSARIAFNSAEHNWYVYFAAPFQGRLMPGAHENLPRYPFQSPSEWGLNVQGENRYCQGALSRFDIKQVRYDSTGTVTRIHATFEQHCDGVPAGLYGLLVFNADTALYILSPQDVYAFPSTPVAFDVTAVDAAGEPITLSASALPPGAAFIDNGDGSGRFEWLGGAPSPGRFVIMVNAEDTSGRTTSLATVVHVHGPDFVRLDSDPGHWVTEGKSYFFQDANATLEKWANTLWAASARATTPEEYFELAFAAPYPRPLGAGRHVAQGAPVGNYSSSQKLEKPTRSCNPGTGWFEVRQVVFGGTGEITRLWVVFEHHCSSAPAVRGEVRINADTSIYVLPPAHVYVLTQTDTAVAVMGRDTRGNPVELAATGVPAGCTFVDHGDGTGALDLNTALLAPGDYQVGFSCTNGLGNQATATTYLHVRQRTVDVPFVGQVLDFGLYGVTPNPTRTSVNISFQLPNDAVAHLQLVDVAGRVVAAREVGPLGPGRHLVSLVQASALRPGCYWVRLRHGSRVLTTSTVILR